MKRRSHIHGNYSSGNHQRNLSGNSENSMDVSELSRPMVRNKVVPPPGSGEESFRFNVEGSVASATSSVSNYSFEVDNEESLVVSLREPLQPVEAVPATPLQRWKPPRNLPPLRIVPPKSATTLAEAPAVLTARPSKGVFLDFDDIATPHSAVTLPNLPFSPVSSESPVEAFGKTHGRSTSHDDKPPRSHRQGPAGRQGSNEKTMFRRPQLMHASDLFGSFFGHEETETPARRGFLGKLKKMGQRTASSPAPLPPAGPSVSARSVSDGSPFPKAATPTGPSASVSIQRPTPVPESPLGGFRLPSAMLPPPMPVPRYVFATTDGHAFRLVVIEEGLRLAVAAAFGFGEVVLHVWGPAGAAQEPLSDEALIVLHAADYELADYGRLCVKVAESAESDDSDAHSKEGHSYPATPQYLLTGPLAAETDYFRFKEFERAETASNFRVIREAHTEIDFDKRRKSPFVRELKSEALVARRAPPPPPPPPLTSTRRSMRIDLSQLNVSKGPFVENVISFANLALDDSSDSDDGLFSRPMRQPHRVSSRDSGSSLGSVRPAPEVLFNHLDRFFPNTDLDTPILAEGPTSGGISRTVSSAGNSGSETAPRRMKTIRAVAREALRERPAVLRRKSTKLWGRPVLEMPTAGEVSRGRTADGQYTAFAWVRGELIGTGTFGRVYLALNVTTGEMMAVKQVDIPRSAQSATSVDALHSEVETMKDLDHLNIVQYLGCEKSDTRYSLFLEYVAGGLVGSCLRMYGLFEEPVIQHLTHQVLEGLAYLHSKGIVHRDLKADNLLLETDGTCKISDFGISKQSKDIYANNAEMSMQGSIFWMAPEVVLSASSHEQKAGYSAKVDVWSLGCVVLEMFAGRRPWSDADAVRALFKLGIAKSAPPIPEDIHVSEGGQRFLDSCFAIDPTNRPTARTLMRHPFTCAPGFVFSRTGLARAMRQRAVPLK